MEDTTLKLICNALAHPIRVLALALLRNRSLSATELRKRLETDKSSLSQHMAKLRIAKLITESRGDRQVTYAVQPWARDLVQQILVARQEHMKPTEVVTEKAVTACSGQESS
jgi:DNA-binding transcriptional ArsR family regulator